MCTKTKRRTKEPAINMDAGLLRQIRWALRKAETEAQALAVDECLDIARLSRKWLQEKGIETTMYVGMCEWNSADAMPLPLHAHYWLTLDNGFIIDLSINECYGTTVLPYIIDPTQSKIKYTVHGKMS